jgi:hypothetical protein
MEAFRALHWADIPFPASRMIDRNQVCAASVFIRGCRGFDDLQRSIRGLQFRYEPGVPLRPSQFR